MKCKACGQEIPDNSVYCTHCGTKCVTQIECPLCHKQVDGDLQFCPHCGAFLKTSKKPVKKKGLLARKKQTVQPQEKIDTTQLTSSSTNDNSTGASSWNPKKKKQFIVIGAILVMGFFGVLAYMISTHDDKKVANAAPKTEQTANTANTKKEKKHAASDLSLDAIYLGESWKDAQRDLGREVSSKSEGNGRVRHKFDDMEVVVTDDVVEALVSDNPSVSTKRGIHPGDTAQAVWKAYGKDYQQSDYETQTYYEYSFNTQDGTPALLRFAIGKGDNKVVYISIRVLTDDITDAENAFLNYHQAISNHQLQQAYQLLSSDFQNSVGGYSSYAAGYKDTLSSDVTDVQLVSGSPSKVVLNYHLKSRDRLSNGGVKIQEFAGNVTMINSNGHWLINDMNAKKIGEHTDL